MRIVDPQPFGAGRTPVAPSSVLHLLSCLGAALRQQLLSEARAGNFGGPRLLRFALCWVTLGPSQSPKEMRSHEPCKLEPAFLELA